MNIFKKEEECKACAVYKEQMDYLKKMVDRLARERENERAEFKRTVDALLLTNKLPAIGQGSAENVKQPDIGKLLGFLEEEKPIDEIKS